jgi:hypothetical protein
MLSYILPHPFCVRMCRKSDVYDAQRWKSVATARALLPAHSASAGKLRKKTPGKPGVFLFR